MGAKKKKNEIKKKCCDKYIKKGPKKRCKRCPCFDMNEVEREKRFFTMGYQGYPINCD